MTYVFCFKYATDRYMNLEAGDDWIARIWRSMGEASCAFIDLTDITEYVDQEIRLVVRCLGIGRVLFIGDPLLRGIQLAAPCQLRGSCGQAHA
jgi:hypothetical protein